jgi:hypothetical protein
MGGPLTMDPELRKTTYQAAYLTLPVGQIIPASNSSDVFDIWGRFYESALALIYV